VASVRRARLSASTSGVLYISYDGMLEPLGESQVLAYLERLAATRSIALVSFEKPDDIADAPRMDAMRARLSSRGIRWMPLRYHKSPAVASTLWDIINGVRHGRRAFAGSQRAAIVHARGYVASLIALTLARLFGAAFVFDMRGFWADEKVDGGHWSRRSRVYAITKYFEQRFFENADAIVSLTRAGVALFPTLGYAIKDTTPIDVIPTCTDMERFQPGARDEALRTRLGLTGHVVIGVSGTMTNWYLRMPMLQCLARLVQRIESAKILIVTREDVAALRADAAVVGIPQERLVITSAPYSQMPDYMRLMDVGLFFIKVCFSKQGSSATKLAEFLATGVPVIINDGIGDSGGIVAEHRAGIVLSEATVAALDGRWAELQAMLADPGTPARCRDAARAYFDVDEGSRAYDRLYERVLAARAPRARRAEARAV
jgi:glycosyltransferase involved in cell wall biosynthesis